MPSLQTQLRAALARVDALETQLACVTEELRVAKATNERLRKEKLAAEHRAQEAEAKLEVAERRIAELEAKLLLAHKDSATSSAPPSSSPRPRRYPARHKTGRAPGGQEGHEGNGREWNRAPDLVVDHRPSRCASCGGDLMGAGAKMAERRQVIDAQVTVATTEHRVFSAQCSCGRKIRAQFPAGVPGTISFGPSVKASVLALSAVGKVPNRVAVDMAAALFGISVSAAVIDTWRRDLAHGLLGFDDRVVELLRHAPVGADESPVRVTKMANAYAHVVVTPSLTRFHLAGRKKADITSGGVLSEHPGCLVTDCLATYWQIGVASHQACLAHLQRELRFFCEAYTPDPVMAPESSHPHPGFGALVDLCGEAVHWRNDAARSGKGPPGTGDLPARLGALVETTAAGFCEKRRTKTDTDALALLRRLKRLCAQGSLFSFAEDLSIPPTNNASEQALRPWKVRQRRSGCFRSEAAAREWLHIAGYLDTARKHGIAPIDALALAVVGQPFMP